MTFICYSTLDPWKLVLKLKLADITPEIPYHFGIKKKKGKKPAFLTKGQCANPLFFINSAFH